MTTRILITNKIDGSKYEIQRDVCHNHPQWVHDQLGTKSESELQAALDGMNAENWYAQSNETHLGPDENGLEMWRPDKAVSSRV
jgi:hypothetical protein